MYQYKGGINLYLLAFCVFASSNVNLSVNFLWSLQWNKTLVRERLVYNKILPLSLKKLSIFWFNTFLGFLQLTKIMQE